MKTDNKQKTIKLADIINITIIKLNINDLIEGQILAYELKMWPSDNDVYKNSTSDMIKVGWNYRKNYISNDH